MSPGGFTSTCGAPPPPAVPVCVLTEAPVLCDCPVAGEVGRGVGDELDPQAATVAAAPATMVSAASRVNFGRRVGLEWSMRIAGSLSAAGSRRNSGCSVRDPRFRSVFVTLGGAGLPD